MTKKQTALVTRDSIQVMLDSDNKLLVAAVIGRGLWAIFQRQTEDEKVTNNTNKYNNVGFTGADAFGGSLTAKFWWKHGRLLDWQVAKWTKKGKNGYARLCKYHKQLNEIAIERIKR